MIWWYNKLCSWLRTWLRTTVIKVTKNRQITNHLTCTIIHCINQYILELYPERHVCSVELESNNALFLHNNKVTFIDTFFQFYTLASCSLSLFLWFPNQFSSRMTFNCNRDWCIIMDFTGIYWLGSSVQVKTTLLFTSSWCSW